MSLVFKRNDTIGSSRNELKSDRCDNESIKSYRNNIYGCCNFQNKMFPKKFSLGHTNDRLYCIQVDSNAQSELLAAIRSGNKATIKEVVNSLGFDDVTLVYGPVSDCDDDLLTVVGLISNKEYSATLNDIMGDTLFTKVEHVPSNISNARKPTRRSVKATARDFGIQKRKHDWQFKK